MKVKEKAGNVSLGSWFRLVKNRKLIFEKLLGNRLRIGRKEFMMVMMLSGNLWGKIVYIPVDQEVELLEDPFIKNC